MNEERLYNVAKHYLWIISQIERIGDPELLMDLEEQRVIWHNKLITVLKREGIPFRDRDHVTLLAHLLTRKYE